MVPVPEDRITELVSRGSRLRLDGAAVAVSRGLAAAGADSLLLKGASLERWLYKEHQPRGYVDCDLLVAPGAEHVSEAVLTSLGYRRQFDDRVMPDWWREHASAWVRVGDGVTIDLHRTLPGVGVADELAWRVLSRGTDIVILAGQGIPSLGLPARALNLALHAAHHGRDWGGVLADLQRGLEIGDQELWRAAAALAAELKATESFGAGLRLTPAGADLAARLELPATRSVRTLLQASTPPPLALGFEHLARARGARARIVILRHKLMPPPAFIRHWDGGTAQSRRAVVRAYLRRPVWLIRHAPRGFRAWRAARASVRAKDGPP